jgi:hypothetical protein
MRRPDAPARARTVPLRPPASRAAAACGLALSLAACTTTPPADWARSAAREADRFVAALFAGPGPETRPLAASLPPAAKPRRPLTNAVSARDPRTGAPLRLTPRALGGGAVEVRQSDGCVWRRDDWFAPSTWWRGCGESAAWRDGAATVSGGGGLWPLRIGAEGRFRRRAIASTGRRYERDTLCRVETAVEVLRPGRAPTPAFVVACEDGKRVRTTWWSPEQGPIAFRKTHRDKGVEEIWVAE